MASNTKTKSKISKLELVFPPMSNQEAVWFKDDPEVEPYLRQSDFYMIGGRPEATFEDFKQNEDDGSLGFKVCIAGGLSDDVRLHILDLPGVSDADPKDIRIEMGPKMVRVWDGPVRQTNSTVLAWFTTEKLLWDRSHGCEGVEGLDRHGEFAVYDLLYVGIAKVGDSFDRLIAKGHHARTEILANEPQRFPGARVSDETYLFLFRVNPLVMQTFEPDHDFADEAFSGQVDLKPIVADAEKAFVSMLKPGYNKVQFLQYPKGADGLYGAGFARYGYLVNEDLTLITAHGRVRGAHDRMGTISNSADFIFVNGEDVRLYVSGVDFPATPWRRVESTEI